DFNGDNIEDSTDPNPSYTYPTTASYDTKLTVSNGSCSNSYQEAISIYPLPTPSFDLPLSPNCTFSEMGFNNTTDESNYQGTSITYSWIYDGEGSSEESTDGTHTYYTDGNYNVILNMAIPGCNTDVVQNIDVIPGPDVNFNMENDCFGEAMQFNNLTTGDNLINPTWDFGDDSGSSTLSDPNYLYTETGDFDVILTMENSEGCVNTLTETIRVNGQPEVAFNHNPGCTDQLISFEDESSPGDALNNVNTWQWDFNSLGTSSDENPDFTFDETGNYMVTLTVGNTGNCFNTAAQTVIVQPTPIADFNIELGCIDTNTGFEDLSETIEENEIASWYWEINGEEYFTQNVEELFTEAGNYTARLTITPNN
ncbi:MAG: PKD domain-containing protein, partial [Reichenbachiella sp.]